MLVWTNEWHWDITEWNRFAPSVSSLWVHICYACMRVMRPLPLNVPKHIHFNSIHNRYVFRSRMFQIQPKISVLLHDEIRRIPCWCRSARNKKKNAPENKEEKRRRDPCIRKRFNICNAQQSTGELTWLCGVQEIGISWNWRLLVKYIIHRNR